MKIVYQKMPYGEPVLLTGNWFNCYLEYFKRLFLMPFRKPRGE